MGSKSLDRWVGFPFKVADAVKLRFGLTIDFLQYRDSFNTYKKIIAGNNRKSGRVLFVAGRGMNISWAQMWTYLSLSFALHNVEPCVLTMGRQWIIRIYFNLVRARIFRMEDFLAAGTQPFSTKDIAKCATVKQWKALHYRNMPVGQMALSTYCRHHATGFIDPSNESLREFSVEWIQNICRAYEAASKLYQTRQISTAVFTETFIEEYGGFYYAALSLGIDVIKTSGTVRDNAIVVQRRSVQNERLHHAALTEPAWQIVKQLKDYNHLKSEVDRNFSDRYGDKWLRSQRNHKNTKIVSREQGRGLLGIIGQRKTVVIFSHILYDTIFHYGDELFQDYATWLIETVKVAIENSRVDWFIKLHPSNLWRGEFQSLLGGKYEEEEIIARHIGALPAHVHLVKADTPISPFSWYQIADYGISVRGTAGLEMACFGKPVITAGTGRYEGKGFTIDPGSVDEYRSILLTLPTLDPLTPAQTQLAVRYAHGLFNMKPFALASLEPRLKFGKYEVRESDDITYVPHPHSEATPLPAELLRFAGYIEDKSQIDLLTKA